MSVMVNPDATFYEHHLREAAPRYFPELASDHITVTLANMSERLVSTLYRYQVDDTTKRYRVLVKVRKPEVRQQAASADSRPRLAVVAANQQYELEYRALMAIHDHFTRLNDPRFGTIRILDVIPECRATIMLESQDPNLRQAFMRRNRLLNPFYEDKLFTAFRHAGAWLRAYHALPEEEYVEVRDHTRDDFIQNIDLFGRYLAQKIGDRRFFEALIQRVHTAAQKTLPAELPLGRGHGDYSFRNILLGPANQVTVLDTMAKWQVPIYEDIAYFLIRLRTNQLAVYSQGLAFSRRWLDDCERAFLSGYFSTEPVPEKQLDLFKLLALLDNWASLTDQLLNQRLMKNKTLSLLRLKLTHRHFYQIAKDLLRRV